MESGLKKAPQDILLATNKEVRMRTDFFGRAHKAIHIDRCWNDTNCQGNCLPELSKLCPTLCVTGSERLSCPDSFLFCTEEHLMFQASAALPFFVSHSSQPAQGVVWARERHFGEQITGFGMLLEALHLPLANRYGSDAAHETKRREESENSWR